MGSRESGWGDADCNVVRLTQRVSRQSVTKLAEGIGRFEGEKKIAKSQVSDFVASDFRKILISGWTETHEDEEGDNETNAFQGKHINKHLI